MNLPLDTQFFLPILTVEGLVSEPLGSALDHGGHMHIFAPGIHVGQRYFRNEIII